MPFDDGKKTVSGSIAHTDDAATKVPFVSVKCGIEPTLTGKSAIECTQTGKNLFSIGTASDTDYFNASTRITDITGNVLTLKIIASGGTFVYRLQRHEKVGTFTLSMTSSKPYSRFFVRIRKLDDSGYMTNSDTSISGWSYNSYYGGWYKDNTSTSAVQTITIPTCLYWELGLGYANNSVTIGDDETLSNIQIEVGSTATTYEPYQTPTQYTAQLGRTIYGGTADVVKGTCEPINWLPNVASSKTQSGIIWTVNDDGTVTLEGTSTARTYLYLHTYFKILPFDATITVNVEGLYDNGASDVFVNIPYSDNGTTYRGSYGQCAWANPTKQIDYTADKYIGFYIDCPSGVTTNQTVKITVSIGTTAHTYSPYFEPFTFTPITPTPETVGKVNNVYCNTGDTELTYYDNAHGFSSVTVTKQAPDQADEVKTAYLHKVIYGGQADVVKGTCEPKNLLKLSDGTCSIGNTGASATISNGSIVVTGTTTSSGGRTTMLSDYFTLKAGTYIISPVISTSPYVRSYLNKKSDNSVVGYSSGSSFTVNEDVEVYFGINVESGYTYDATITPQLEAGSSVSDYAPYFDPFTFPPISMETDEGENNLFAIQGDSAITYRKAVD